MEDQRFQQIREIHESGDKERAITELGALLDKSCETRDKAQLMFTLIHWLMEMNRIDDARSHFERVRSTMPKDGEWWAWAEYCQAELLFAEQKYKAALKKFDDLREVYLPKSNEPGFEEAYTDIQSRRGILLANLSKFRDARPVLEEVASRDAKQDGSFYYMLALCYLEEGKNELARDTLRMGFQVGYPSSYEPSAHYQLGLAHYHLGSLARAFEEFELCLPRLDETTVPRKEFYKLVAEICHALGLESEALRFSDLSKSV